MVRLNASVCKTIGHEREADNERTPLEISPRHYGHCHLAMNDVFIYELIGVLVPILCQIKANSIKVMISLDINTCKN